MESSGFRVPSIVEPQLQGGELRRTKKKGGVKMRYLITWEPREPVEENWKKAREISQERIKKGESWGDDNLIGTHIILSEAKGLQIVDTDVKKLAKWVKAYANVYNIKISPIMHVDEWREATK